MIDLTTLPKPTQEEAARFLNQATWGFNSTDLAYLMANGYRAWFIRQQLVPYEETPGHYNWLTAYHPPNATSDTGEFMSMAESAIRRAAESRDLLRQKLTFALSQILVASGTTDPYHPYRHIAMGSYYDLLGMGAFGKYEDLLAQVSRTVFMGNFLTFINSKKAGGTSSPDENYAREIHQLFTIGVDVLDQDTSLPVKTGPNVSDNLEAYGIDHIRSAAKLFTGFYVSSTFKQPDDYSPSNGHGVLDFNPADHDTSTITLRYPVYKGGVQQPDYTIVVPGGNDGILRVDTFVRALAKHPNVGAFLARQLIQRFVTSNPSASYVKRVADVYYQHNGSLAMMVRAVLMDESLFDADKRRVGGFGADNKAFGKVREPFARLTQWARLFSARSIGGKWYAGEHPVSPHHLSQFGQSPLMAKSVFNFYRPGYVYPAGAETQLSAPDPMQIWGGAYVAPELQLVNEYTCQTYLSAIYQALDGAQGVGGGKDIVSTYSGWTSKANNPALLVAELNLMLAAGRVNAAATQQVIQAVSVMPGSTEADRRKRVQAAAFLLMIAPEYIVQK